jgi:hypothetical protein
MIYFPATCNFGLLFFNLLLFNMLLFSRNLHKSCCTRHRQSPEFISPQPASASSLNRGIE